MSEREQQPGSAPEIREALRETVNQLLEQQGRLGLAVIGAISSGDATPEEVSTALSFMQEISGAAKRVVDEKGQYIFVNGDGVLKDSVSDNGAAPTAIEITKQPRKPKESQEPEPAGPKSFRELLEKEVEEFLPEGDHIEKNQLYQLAGSKVGVRNAAERVGLSNQKRKYSRGDAKLVIMDFVRRTSARKTKDKDVLTKKDVRASYFPTDQAGFNEISQTVGHDWDKVPEVSRDEALNMRGIKQLRNIVKRNNEGNVSGTEENHDDDNTGGGDDDNNNSGSDASAGDEPANGSEDLGDPGNNGDTANDDPIDSTVTHEEPRRGWFGLGRGSQGSDSGDDSSSLQSS